MAKARDELDDGLDALYAAPLAEFVSARDALAKSLASSGRKEDAARVKALKKPAAAAWAVNRLALGAPKLLAALVASGDRLRAKPSAAAESMRERRDLLNEARKAAEKVLLEAGHAAPPDLMRRVSATLEAIAAYGSSPGRPVAGRLTEDVPAPGFDEIASLGLLGAAGAVRSPAPRPPATETPAQAAPPPPKAARDAGREAARERALEEKRRRDAEKALAAREKEAREARAALRAAEKAAEAIRRRKASLEEELARAAAEEKRLEAALANARRDSEAADAAEDEARLGAGRGTSR